LAKFRFISEHFEWTEKQQLLYLRTNLEGAAGELLWSHPELSTMDEVVGVLQNRFGTQNQRERFRIELRTIRRKSGEDLQTLYQEVVRLMSLAYPNERSEAAEVVARDAFLEALNDSAFHFRILERDPHTIEDALKIAIRLEAYERAADHFGTNDSKTKMAQRTVRVIDHFEQGPAENSETELKRIISLLSELKAENARLRADMETALVGIRYADRATLNVSDQRKRNKLNRAADDVCNRCGALGHWARNCTLEEASSTSAKSTERCTNANSFVSGVIAAGSERYIAIHVGGNDIRALLDTGCSRSCIARRFVPRVPLEPPDDRLYAANGVAITNLGAFTVRFKIGNLDLEARLQVSDELDEMILGYDWLRKNRCHWDFEANELTINGQKFSLSSTPCRRLIRKGRSRRNRRQSIWREHVVCGVLTNKSEIVKPRKIENMEKQTFVCSQRHGDVHVCERTFSTDSGIRRHFATARECRYHADRSPSHAAENGRQERVAPIEVRQRISRTHKRNARRRLQQALELQTAAETMNVAATSTTSYAAAVAVIQTSSPADAPHHTESAVGEFDVDDWGSAVADYWSPDIAVGNDPGKLDDTHGDVDNEL
jgi:predicted aspartyl protease